MQNIKIGTRVKYNKNGALGTVIEVNENFFNILEDSTMIPRYLHESELSDFTILTGLQAMKVGDILVNEGGDEMKILMINSEMFVTSRSMGDNYFLELSNYIQAESFGWKLKSDTEVEAAIKLLEERGRIRDGKLVE